jgi:NO-binding membrane sensor protein with MHYT domain
MVQFADFPIDGQTRLVVLAGLVCLVACLASFALLIRARVGGAYRPRGALAAALVFALGLAATLFVFMLAFHPAIGLGYQLAATLLSIAAALVFAWFALAVAVHLRAADGMISGGRYADGAAARPGAEFNRLGDAVSRVTATAWRGGGRCRAIAAVTLLALAICALDFIAIRGVPPAGGPVAETGSSVLDEAAMALPPRGPARLADRERPARVVPGLAATLARPAAFVAPRAPRIPAVKDRDIAALATEIATAQNIDPSLVLAVIAAESGFQSDAVSSGNAQGLMQLMPETARRFGAHDPLDPAENIRAGTLYLRWLLAYFEGDLSLVLAAYNAGEGAVVHYGGVPPFPETRAYLRRIRTLYPAEHHPFDQLAVR